MAVFVDGCYWHGCPEHGVRPTTNSEYWRSKIARNQARDARDTQALGGDGWAVVRVWEHEAKQDAAERIEQEVRARRASATPRR